MARLEETKKKSLAIRRGRINGQTYRAIDIELQKRGIEPFGETAIMARESRKIAGELRAEAKLCEDPEHRLDILKLALDHDNTAIKAYASIFPFLRPKMVAKRVVIETTKEEEEGKEFNVDKMNRALDDLVGELIEHGDVINDKL